MKTCRGCGDTKPLDMFNRCKTVKDGRKARCKACTSRANAEWRRANPGKGEAATSRWRSANRERVAETKAAWAKANPEAIRESRKRTAPARAERLARWKADNRERVREYQRRRRAAGYGGAAGAVDLDLLRSKSDGSCAICRESIDWAAAWPAPKSASLDHILPLSKGGSHTQDNVQWTCLECNLRKGSKIPAGIKA